MENIIEFDGKMSRLSLQLFVVILLEIFKINYCILVRFYFNYKLLVMVINNYFFLQKMPRNFRFDRSEIITIDTSYIQNYTLHITKFNRTTTVLNSNFTLLKPLEDTCVIEIELFGYQGNEYRKLIPTIRIEKCCNFMKNDKIIYPGLEKSTNLPKQNDDMCPLKPQYIWFKNTVLELDKAPIPYNVKQLKIILNIMDGNIDLMKNTYYIIAED